MKVTSKSKKSKMPEQIEELINEVNGEEKVNEPVKEEVISEESANEEVVETIVTKNRDDNHLLIEDKINKWKLDYEEVFETVVSGHKFIWKPLTRNEYRKGYDAEDRDMTIIKSACLYPNEDIIEELVNRKAGIGFVLIEIILSESGFNVESSVRL